MSKEQKNNWYATIQASVICATDISANEKLLIALIDNLSTDNKPCYASNKYLGDLLGINKNSISRMVTDLVKKGYLHNSIKRDSNKVLIQRHLTVIERTDNPTTFNPMHKKEYTPYTEKSIPPTQECVYPLNPNEYTPYTFDDVREPKINTPILISDTYKPNVNTSVSNIEYSNIDTNIGTLYIENIDNDLNSVLGIRNWLKNNNRVFDKYINGPNDLLDNLSYFKGDVDKKVNYLLNNSIEVLELYPN